MNRALQLLLALALAACAVDLEGTRFDQFVEDIPHESPHTELSRDVDPRPVHYFGLGATQTVSGSLHVLETEAGDRYVVDVGVFMGPYGENHPWPTELPPSSIRGVFLTHAHADHVGRLPLLFEEGYEGPVYLTRHTYDLVRIALAQNVAFTDMGPEVFYHSRHNTGDRIPVYLPGYDFGRFTVRPQNRVHFTARRTELDSMGFYLASAQRDQLASRIQARLDRQAVIVEIGRPFQAGSFEVTAVHTSHMPGSSMFRFERDGRVVAFTGDAGGNTSPLFPPNEVWGGNLDALFVEGTYWGGDSIDVEAEQEEFRRRVGSLIRDGYRVVIPAFVMDRTQQVLYHLDLGMRSGEIPPETRVRAYSPSAHRFTELYEEYGRQLRRGDSSQSFSSAMLHAHFRPGDFRPPNPGEMDDLMLSHGEIGVMGSGMADHGAARQAILQFVGDPQTAFYTVGYQADETLGRVLRETSEGRGQGFIEVDGERLPFRADAFHTRGFSGHANRQEIARVFGPSSPSSVFIVHLDAEGVPELSAFYQEAFGATVIAPEYGVRYRLW